MGALVMNAFSPESENPPSARRAVVRSANASLPASGSVRAQQPRRANPSTGAAHLSRCAGVPRRKSDCPHSPRLAPNESANPGSTRVSSWSRMPLSSGLESRPALAPAPAAASRASSGRPSASASSRISARCLLVRGAGHVALVDTGMGDDWPPKQRDLFAIDRSATLLSGLASRGVAPDDVSDVVLTHLHFDHAGGLSHDGALTFPRATHHLQRRNWEWAQAPTERDRGSFRPEN